MTDLAVLGQDPGFGGGTLAMTESFWRAAESLGRRPELQYLRYRALDERRDSGPSPRPERPAAAARFGRGERRWRCGRDRTAAASRA